jgi:hypothetical protein
MSTQDVIVGVVAAAVFGVFGMLIAASKGRSWWLGLLVGATGLPGWIVLALIPAKRRPVEAPALR